MALDGQSRSEAGASLKPGLSKTALLRLQQLLPEEQARKGGADQRGDEEEPEL